MPGQDNKKQYRPNKQKQATIYMNKQKTKDE